MFIFIDLFYRLKNAKPHDFPCGFLKTNASLFDPVACLNPLPGNDLG